MFQVGQILDNGYQLIEPLKIAGVRQTWRSIDLIRQTACIIKLLRFDSTLQWQDYEEFEHEVKILKRLQGNRLPRYRAEPSLQVDGTHWLAFVQEEVPGTSLQTLLEQHRFREAELQQIAIELLQTVRELHEQYPLILHCDINPAHILLTPERSVYLIGFGSAQMGATAQDGIGSGTNSTGTDGYVPPEQLSGQTVPASDLYAVGATIVHLLTGICPADLPQHQQKIQFYSFVSISDRFSSWLTKMLEPDVNQRFQTANQALSALLVNESQIQPQTNSIVSTVKLSQHSLCSEFSVSDRVKVNASGDRLQIRIAKRGIRFADALWLGTGVLTGGVSALMLLSHVHPVLSLLCWLDSLPLFGIGLISALGEATLTVNSATSATLNSPSETALSDASSEASSEASVAIQWNCLGVPYRRIRQRSAIVTVQSSSPAGSIDSVPSAITIQTDYQQYSIGQFSPQLNQAEAEGVVRWVRAWRDGLMRR